MTLVTLRVLDGADRGRVFSDLQTPFTIGREDGNGIQLNDERISRFHVKIQVDQEMLVLTDLESTNGTKVNGEDIQLRILRYGDIIHVGRSLLLYGTREQIAGRLAEMRKSDDGDTHTLSAEELADKLEAASLDVELNWSEDPDLQSTFHALEPPELPERLSPGQAAQLVELLEYIHVRMRNLIATGRPVDDASPDDSSERIALDVREWQNLIDLQARVAEYLRRIAEPGA